MKSLMFAGLAALALAAAAPEAGDAQVRVSVRVDNGYRHGYVQRVYRYTPRPSYGGYHYAYSNSYRGHGYAARGYRYAAPRVQVVRVYRPAPVVIIHRNNHRGYRHR